MPSTAPGADAGSRAPAGLAPHERILPQPLPADPFPLFVEWFEDAHRRTTVPNPNAMTIATATPDGVPSARIVLCKAIDAEKGALTFYTNRQGRKGRELEANPVAAAAFHWDQLDRQVRLEGPVVHAPEQVSDAYFASRPWISRVSAWASSQSEPVDSREALAERLNEAMRRFGLDPADPPAPDEPVDIPRPPHWGGYTLWPRRLELWVGGLGRLHDRAHWVRTLTPTSSAERPFEPGEWRGTRLQP